MSVLVFVDVFDIFKLVLKVEGQDTIGDVKQLIEQATGIPHQDVRIQYGKKGNMKLLNDDLEIYHFTYHDAELETIYVNYSMTSPTIQALRISNEILALQDDLKGEKAQRAQKGELTLTPTLVFLSCQGEPPAVAYSKDLTQPDGYPKASASVVAPKGSYAELKQEIERLEFENEKYNTSIKENKTVLKGLKQQLKLSEVQVNLRFPSGNCYQVRTSVGKTIKQFRMEDLTKHATVDVKLVYETQVMLNRRRLFSYGIVDGSTIDIVVQNTNIIETSEEELEALQLPTIPDNQSECGGSSLDDSGDDYVYSFEADIGDDLSVRRDVEGCQKVLLKTKTGTHSITLFAMPSDLVSDLVNEVSDITELQKGSYVLIGAVSGEKWGFDRSISSLGYDNFTAFIQLTLSGGGKRKEPTGGVNTESKGTKLDKIEQAKDNLRTAIMKAQMATGADTSGYHQTLTDMFGQLQAHLENPASVMLNSLGINDLKSIQGVLFTTRLEYKYQSMIKVFFGVMHQAMTESGKRNLALMDAQKALLTWSLLQEFGDDDNGSISWNKMNKTVMDIMQSKMSAPNPAPTA